MFQRKRKHPGNTLLLKCPRLGGQMIEMQTNIRRR